MKTPYIMVTIAVGLLALFVDRSMANFLALGVQQEIMNLVEDGLEILAMGLVLAAPTFGVAKEDIPPILTEEEVSQVKAMIEAPSMGAKAKR